MNAIYFQTHFRTEEPVEEWPGEFAIITAYATTGEDWTVQRNEREDARLQDEFKRRKIWHRRITGYHPDSGHAEPGWAAELSLRDACRLGAEFLQDAIYFVMNGLLAVSECKDGRRELVPVGRFAERLTPESKV